MPSNFPRTWSGKALAGSVSGFTSYDVEREVAPAEPAPILSPDDLVAAIREMRKYLDLNQISAMLKTLEQHVADLGNPHQTTLSQFPDDVLDVLYQAYQDNQGTGSKEDFTSALYASLRIASSTEMHDPETYGGLLVSVRAAYELIKEHEADPAAHAGLFTEMIPGTPISDIPVEALYPYVGIDQSHFKVLEVSHEKFPQTAVLGRESAYVDPCGVVRFTSWPDDIRSDFSQGRALFPCFSTRCNYYFHCTNLLNAIGTTYAGALEISTVKAPDGSNDAVLLHTYKDTIPVEHGYRIGTFAVTPSEAKTVSIHVKAGSCDLVELSATCSDPNVLNPKLIFDMNTGNYVLSNPLSNVKAGIERLANGWSRISLSISATDIYTYTFKATFFKKNSEDLASVIKTYIADGEICAHLWGVQVENGFSASPLIQTDSAEVFRKPVAISIKPESWNTNNWTLYIAVKRPNVGKDIDRPLFVVLNSEGKTVTDCYYKTDGTIQLRRMIHSSNDGGVSAVTMTETFNISNNEYDQFVYSADSRGTITRYNQENGLNLAAPLLIDAGSEILIGADRNGTCLDGYISGVLVYKRKVTDEEVDFLSGEEL